MTLAHAKTVGSAIRDSHRFAVDGVQTAWRHIAKALRKPVKVTNCTLALFLAETSRQRNSRRSPLCLRLTLLIFMASPAQAAESDWPCIQRKVPELSVAAIWTGPDLGDAAKTWNNDPALKDLVPRLAARRTPIEAAAKLVSEFAANASKAQLLGLFAGLFDSLDGERKRILEGIERYGKKQKQLAERIRKAQDELPKWKDDESGKYEELQDQIVWDTRIFEERQKSLTFVCEVPILIERRAFDLAHKIAAAAEAKP
jgi:hypothetical protein